MPPRQMADEAQVVFPEQAVLSGRGSPLHKMAPDESCWQRSNFVHGLSSLQPQRFGWLGSEGTQPVETLVRTTWTHPVPSGGAIRGLHVSTLQLLPSLQRASWGVEMHVPLPSHTSAVQTMASLFSQLVPAGVLASAGHAVLVPVHRSAGSQTPVEARQTVPALPAGCWQALLVPSH